MSLELTSPAFDSGKTIPTEYTCEGENISPPLTWKGIPEETDNLVLICDDPDAQPGPNEPFTHWVLYNIPPNLEEIPEGFSSKGKKKLRKAMEGINSFGKRDMKVHAYQAKNRIAMYFGYMRSKAILSYPRKQIGNRCFRESKITFSIRLFTLDNILKNK